jgi:hypothetical protein
MEGGTLAGWGDFLVAVSGAAGALAGLVFVALSINLGRILESPGVSGRAGETILLLAGSLVGSLLALVPYPSARGLGLVMIAVGLPTWILPTSIQIQALRQGHYQRLTYTLLRLLLHQAATLPFLVAGLSLHGLFGGGMYWLAAALVLSLVVALINAWVLLVEILR